MHVWCLMSTPHFLDVWDQQITLATADFGKNYNFISLVLCIFSTVLTAFAFGFAFGGIVEIATQLSHQERLKIDNFLSQLLSNKNGVCGC